MMSAAKGIMMLGVFAVSALLLATMLEGIDGAATVQQNFAILGGSFLFLFVGIVVGLPTKSIGAAVLSASVVTGIVEYYIDPTISIFMLAIVVMMALLGILSLYLESRPSSYGYL